MVTVWKKGNIGNLLINRCYILANTLTTYILILVAFFLPLEGEIYFIVVFEMVQPGDNMRN